MTGKMGRNKTDFDGPRQQRLPGHRATHRNRRLFSNYYLGELLPRQAEGQQNLDGLVHRLYGLTEEEIRVVEGAP